MVSTQAHNSLAAGPIPCDNRFETPYDATELLRSTDVGGASATDLTGVTQILASIERGDPHAAEVGTWLRAAAEETTRDSIRADRASLVPRIFIRGYGSQLGLILVRPAGV